jgi:hypothetical protein
MLCKGYNEGWKRELSIVLFLGWFDSLAVLASNDLNLLSLNHLVRLHLERGVLDYERPDVVAEAVRLQVTLKGESWYEGGGVRLMVATHLKSSLGLDLLDHGVRQRLVKLRESGKSTIIADNNVGCGLADLLEDLHGQLGCDSATGDQLVQGVG